MHSLFYHYYYYLYIINFVLLLLLLLLYLLILLVLLLSTTIIFYYYYFYLHYKNCWDLLFLDSYFYHCNFRLKFCTLQCSAYFRNALITSYSPMTAPIFCL